MKILVLYNVIFDHYTKFQEILKQVNEILMLIKNLDFKIATTHTFCGCVIGHVPNIELF